MVAYLTRCLVEPDAPRPSIETLLHAFLPAAHVDHVHADAICALANAPDPEAAVHEALGDDVAVVPYLRPGFELSKRVAELADARAVVLAHHGLVTWGETHEESYGLTLELVERARALPRRAPAPRRARRGARRRRPSSASSRGCAAGSRASGGRCSRSTAGQRALADRADVETLAGAAQHARPHAPDRRAHLRARPRRRRRRGGRPRSRPRARRSTSATRPATRRCSRPRRGSCSCAASAASRRRPTRAAARRGSSSPRTRTRTVAATLDALRRRELARRARGLRLRVLAARALQADARAAAARARRARSRSSPAPRRASAARSPATSPRAARTSCSPTSTPTAWPRPPSRSTSRVSIAGDLTDPAVVDELVHARGRERTAASTRSSSTPASRATGRARRAADEDEWRRSLDVNLTAQFLLTQRVWPVLARAGHRRQPRLRRVEERVRAGRRLRPVLGREGRARPAREDRRARGRRRRDPRERRQPRRDLRRLAPLVGRAPPRARRGARRRGRRARGASTRRGACSAAPVTAADVAEAVAFLVSDRSRATTGCTITVDGGVPAAFPR